MKPRFAAPFAQSSFSSRMAHFVAPLCLLFALGCGVHEDESPVPSTAQSVEETQIVEANDAPEAAVRADSARKPINPEAIFVGHCAGCHGAARYGGYAPPLIPQALSRKSDEDLVQTVLEGRPNTQMAPFNPIMQEQDARDMIAYLRTEVGEISWSMDQIRESWREIRPEELAQVEGEEAAPAPVEKPAVGKEFVREDVILVVERGTSSISVLNGETLM